jgi:hypothetical protein
MISNNILIRRIIMRIIIIIIKTNNISIIFPKVKQTANANPGRFGIKKSFGPILCVCYTNHALDQFLEGILKNR